MRPLVLGGTRFLGRAIVDVALGRGHEPTLFNRGLTNPDLFPDVERLVGDRSSDLSSLEGRLWDAVIDVAAYFPRVVQLSVDALRDSAQRYLFVSSISVYADQSTPPVEGAAVAELDDPDDPSVETYGARKAASERIVEEAFGDRGYAVWSGDYYAVEVMKRLGLEDGGAVRAGVVHYNTAEEVDGLLDALASL